MSGVLPATKIARIEFCEAHNTPFSSNAVAIGTTVLATTDLATKTVAARAAFNAQQAAQNAAKAATNDYKIAVNAMTTAVADILKQIKAKAAITGPSVYSLAEIPAPAIPSPRPAPGKPTGFVVTLEENGALTLKWKCPNPAGSSGTLYQVFRRNTPTGDFNYLGASGTKSFVDATIPAGSGGVTYQIQAVRSTIAGPLAQFNVNFGVSGGGGGGGGEMMASVVETAPSRIAA
jgi:hypothetical protein